MMLFYKDIFLIPCRLSSCIHTALVLIMVKTEACGGVGCNSPGMPFPGSGGQGYLQQTPMASALGFLWTGVLSRAVGYLLSVALC